VIAFKKRRRKNSRRKRGYRHEFSVVRITEILTGGAKPSKTAAPRPKREPKPKVEAAPAAEAKPAKTKAKKPAKAAAKKPAKATKKSGNKKKFRNGIDVHGKRVQETNRDDYGAQESRRILT
jgi:large subunit ribosomal protein L21